MRSIRAALLLVGLAFAVQAHVGSSDIFLDGQAGPYKLFITIRPPSVIPGVAEVEIRSQSPNVREIRVVPVPLNRAGSQLAPVPDRLKVSSEDAQHFTGSLWIMTTGSWQVRITADGADGRGEVAVPVAAYALSTKKLDGGLGVILFVLMLLLAAGMVLIVGASVREGQLQPGARPDAGRISRSRLAMIKAAVVVSVILGLGFWWWSSAEGDYRQKIYKPLSMSAVLARNTLTLTLSDPGWMNLPGTNVRRLSPTVFVRTIDDLVPDHDHLMHLYAIRQPGLDEVYHLHPQLVSAGVFRLALPDMKPGNYRLYADIVHANGFPETPVASLLLPQGITGRPLEGDDASGSALPWQQVSLPETSFRLSDGYSMQWVRSGGELRARAGSIFRFRLLDPTGKPASNMRYYMGMLGHAAFVKTDGTVFAHIHPTGSVSMASFMLAESQLPDGAKGAEPKELGNEMAGMDMEQMSHVSAAAREGLPNEVTFPYGFPTVGRYRIFVQMKHDDTVETGAFDVDVK